MKNRYFVVAFVFATFILITVDFALVSNYLSVLQGFYPYWQLGPANFVLSDVLFIEGALLLIAGAIMAGFSLYTITYRPNDDRLKYNYVKSGFNWEAIKKEHDIPSTLGIGLVLLGVGIACIVAAVVVTL